MGPDFQIGQNVVVTLNGVVTQVPDSDGDMCVTVNPGPTAGEFAFYVDTEHVKPAPHKFRPGQLWGGLDADSRYFVTRTSSTGDVANATDTYGRTAYLGAHDTITLLVDAPER